MWFIGMHRLLGDLDGGEDQRDGHGRHTRMLPCEEPGIDIRRTVNMDVGQNGRPRGPEMLV